MNIFYAAKHAYNHVATPLIPLWTHLAARRARTRRGNLSNRILNVLGQTAAHAWKTSRCNSGSVEVGSLISRIQTPHWALNMPNGFMPVLRDGKSMTPTSCCARKAGVSRTVWGMELSWTYKNFVPKRLSSRKYIIAKKSAVVLTDEGSV